MIALPGGGVVNVSSNGDEIDVEVNMEEVMESMTTAAKTSKSSEKNLATARCAWKSALWLSATKSDPTEQQQNEFP